MELIDFWYISWWHQILLFQVVSIPNQHRQKSKSQKSENGAYAAAKPKNAVWIRRLNWFKIYPTPSIPNQRKLQTSTIQGGRIKVLKIFAPIAIAISWVLD